MRYYLDTNILVFIILGQDDDLSRDVRALLEDYGNIFMPSTVCLQELVCLVQAGRIEMPKGTDTRRAAQAAVKAVIEWGVEIVPASLRHIETLAELPLHDSHHDPNDRLIIAQAIADRLPLVSSDSKFPRYAPHGLRFIYNER